MSSKAPLVLACEQLLKASLAYFFFELAGTFLVLQVTTEAKQIPNSLCNSVNRSNCKGQVSIPSVSTRKIHFGSLTLIRLTLQWDAFDLLLHNSIRCPRLYPSYPSYSSTKLAYLSLLRVNRIHTTSTFADVRHYLNTRKSRGLNAGTKRRGKYMNNTGNPKTATQINWYQKKLSVLLILSRHTISEAL